tara:strand:+ start:40969 stop:41109 length:141 start_codon:yes stop_codon:yes gene_type:complete
MNYRETKIAEKKASKASNKVARVYKSKDSRVKDALAFKTPKKTKLA